MMSSLPFMSFHFLHVCLFSFGFFISLSFHILGHCNENLKKNNMFPKIWKLDVNHSLFYFPFENLQKRQFLSKSWVSGLQPATPLTSGNNQMAHSGPSAKLPSFDPRYAPRGAPRLRAGTLPLCPGVLRGFLQLCLGWKLGFWICFGCVWGGSPNLKDKEPRIWKHL